MAKIDDLLFGLTDMALPEEETTRDQVKQTLYSDILELIGEDFKHPNGKYMKNPAFECEECGGTDQEYTVNIVQREIRTKLKEYFNL